MQTDKQTEGWVKVIRGMKSRVSQKEKSRRVAIHLEKIENIKKYGTRKQPNEHKLSHGGTATWHNENLLVERTAPTAVGSGDLLGHDLTDEMKESLANGHSVKLKSGLVMYPPNYKSDLPRPHLQTWIESSDSKPKIAD